ncbi:hypothetical protein DFQ26_005064 [Actinomortierella ambigua]|nr:hypothetical protein DFQ26_005064 [Actinomortierella ambigua]
MAHQSNQTEQSTATFHRTLDATGIADLCRKAHQLSTLITEEEARYTNELKANNRNEIESAALVKWIDETHELTKHSLESCRASIIKTLEKLGVCNVAKAISDGLANSDKLLTATAPFRNALAQCAADVFQISAVPIFDRATHEVNFDRIPIGYTWDKVPSLNVKWDDSLQGKELSVHILMEVDSFLEDFEHRLKNYLGDLFPYLAYRYMSSALGDSFGREFRDRINYPIYIPRDWAAVKKCVADILRLEELLGDANSALFSIHRLPGEDVLVFATRLERLHRITGDESFDTRLIRYYFTDLPQAGRDQVTRHFGSLAEIPSFQSYLDFLKKYPSVYDGTGRVDSTAWHRKYLRVRGELQDMSRNQLLERLLAGPP